MEESEKFIHGHGIIGAMWTVEASATGGRSHAEEVVCGRTDGTGTRSQLLSVAVGAVCTTGRWTRSQLLSVAAGAVGTTGRWTRSQIIGCLFVGDDAQSLFWLDGQGYFPQAWCCAVSTEDSGTMFVGDFHLVGCKFGFATKITEDADGDE